MFKEKDDMSSKTPEAIRTVLETTWEEEAHFPRNAMTLDFKTVDLVFPVVFVTFGLFAVSRIVSMRHSYMLYTKGLLLENEYQIVIVSTGIWEG